MLHIRLLGGFEILDSGERLPGLSRPRRQALLAYLLLHRDVPQSRVHLAFTFWPDSTESQARTNLRKELHFLKRALGERTDCLRVGPQAVSWNHDQSVELDVAAFEAATQDAATARDEQARTEPLERAAASYQGDLLPGLYDEWVLEEREALAQSFIRVLEQLIAAYTALRDYPLAIGAAQRLLRYDPLYEAGYLTLMELYAYLDERARALHLYHTYASTLERELGADPNPEVRQLYERLLRSETVVEVEGLRDTTESLRLVGRVREWQILLRQWRRASRGHAHLVLIEGEAGLGKTRLAEELLAWVTRQGVTALRSRAYGAEGSLAFAPIAAWMTSEQLRPRVDKLEPPVRAALAPLLPDLSGIEAEPNESVPSGVGWRRRQLFEALALVVTATDRPQLLLIDDLQWCDRETLQWLRYLMHFDPKAPVLVVATARMEETDLDHPARGLTHALAASRQLTEIGLKPLTAAQALDLVDAVSEGRLSRIQAEALFAASEGNPLFVVEMVRAGYPLDQDIYVRPNPDRSPSTAVEGLPPKVLAVIESRLAQLSPRAREMSTLAATVGRSFNYELLVAVSGDSEDAVVTALDELWRRRIIREQGVNAYDFSHDRIRDVAYAETSPVLRNTWHRRIAESLERLHEHDPDAVSGRIATHYERAGVLTASAIWHGRAALAADQVYARAEAMAHVEACLALLEKLPADEDSKRRQIQMLLLKDDILFTEFGAPAKEREPVLLRARDLYAEIDTGGHVDVPFHLITFYSAQGRYHLAREVADEEMAAARRLGDPLRLHDALANRGPLAFVAGEFRRSSDLIEESLSITARLEPDLADSRDVELSDLIGKSWLFNAYWILGFPDRALETATEVLARSGIDRPSEPIGAYLHAAMLGVNLGRPGLLQDQLRTLTLLGDKYDFRLARHEGWIYQGLDMLTRGEIVEGLALTRRGVEGFRGIGHRWGLTWRLAILVRMHLMAGQWGEAQSVLDEAFSLSDEMGERYTDAELCRLQGDLLLAGDSETAAEDAYQRGISIARKQQARSYELRTLTTLCRLWMRQGKSQYAGEQLAALYDWFTEGFDTHDLTAARRLMHQLH